MQIKDGHREEKCSKIFCIEKNISFSLFVTTVVEKGLLAILFGEQLSKQHYQAQKITELKLNRK